MNNISDVVKFGVSETKNIISAELDCEYPFHTWNNEYMKGHRKFVICKKCGYLVCSFCTNENNTTCVFCEIKKRRIDTRKRCNDCKFLYRYSTCYQCGILMKRCAYVCSAKTRGNFYDGDYPMHFKCDDCKYHCYKKNSGDMFVDYEMTYGWQYEREAIRRYKFDCYL